MSAAFSIAYVRLCVAPGLDWPLKKEAGDLVEGRRLTGVAVRGDASNLELLFHDDRNAVHQWAGACFEGGAPHCSARDDSVEGDISCLETSRLMLYLSIFPKYRICLE